MKKFKVQWNNLEVIVLDYNLNTGKFLVAAPSRAPGEPAKLHVVHIDELELTTQQIFQLSLAVVDVH
jgi:hypothetical protein